MNRSLTLLVEMKPGQFKKTHDYHRQIFGFLYWLFPGKELVNCLRPINDEKECSNMLKCTTNGSVADVYAEVVHKNSEDKDESGSEGDDHAISIPIAIAIC